MISKLSHVNLWVLNKDDAIAFYRDTLGFEVRQNSERVSEPFARARRRRTRCGRRRDER